MEIWDGGMFGRAGKKNDKKGRRLFEGLEVQDDL